MFCTVTLQEDALTNPRGAGRAPVGNDFVACRVRVPGEESCIYLVLGSGDGTLFRQ